MNKTEALRQENKKLLVELFSICMDINYGETDHVAFFDVSGHVDTVGVSVRESRDNYQNAKTFAQFYRLASAPEITTVAELKDRNKSMQKLIDDVSVFYTDKKLWFADMEDDVKLELEVLRKKKNERLCLLPSGETLWIDSKKAAFKKNNIIATKRFATDNNIPYSEL